MQANGGREFEQLSGEEQDRYLTALQTSPRDLAGVPSNVFLESPLEMAIEGNNATAVAGSAATVAPSASMTVTGEGSAAASFPRIAGQSPSHLLRQLQATPAAHARTR